MPTGWQGLSTSLTCKNYFHFRSSNFFTTILLVLYLNSAQCSLPQTDLTTLTLEDFKNAEQLGKGYYWIQDC